MNDLSPWQNSDIPLQNIICQNSVRKRKPFHRASISQGQTKDINQISLPTRNHYQRFKTSCLSPVDKYGKYFEEENDTNDFEKSLNLDLFNGFRLRQKIKSQHLYSAQFHSKNSKQLLRQQFASIFLRESKKFQSCQHYKYRMKIKDEQIFKPLNKLSRQRKQLGLVLPKIKIGNKSQKMQKDRRYFFNKSIDSEAINRR